MKNLNALNLGKSLKRDEMKNIMGGTVAYDCTCGTNPPQKNVQKCSCLDLCSGKCKENE